MNRILRLGAASLFALGLGGCTSTVMVQDYPGPREDYFDGDFEYATRDGFIVAEVVGNPFNMPQERFDAAVRDLMDGQTAGPPVTFLKDPTPGKTDAQYRVVVAFNTPSRISGFDLCEKGAKTPTVRGGGELSLAMAFCIGEDLKSDIRGSTTPVAGSGAPRFVELVREVTLALIPVQDGEDVGEGDANVP